MPCRSGVGTPPQPILETFRRIRLFYPDPSEEATVGDL